MYLSGKSTVWLKLFFSKMAVGQDVPCRIASHRIPWKWCAPRYTEGARSLGIALAVPLRTAACLLHKRTFLRDRADLSVLSARRAYQPNDAFSAFVEMEMATRQHLAFCSVSVSVASRAALAV